MSRSAPLLFVLSLLAVGGACFVAGRLTAPPEVARAVDTPPRSVHPAASEPSADLVEPRAQRAPETAVSDAELETLRAEVARLQRELRAARAADVASHAPEVPADLDALLRELADLSPNTRASIERRKARENALLRALLARYPDHEDAGRWLRDLAGNLVSTDPVRALAALDEFGARVELPPGELDSLRANALHFSGRDEESRALYAALAHDPSLPESVQCENAFWHAYALERAGRLAEARGAYEALLARVGDDVPPELRGTIAGARARLDELLD